MLWIAERGKAADWMTFPYMEARIRLLQAKILGSRTKIADFGLQNLYPCICGRLCHPVSCSTPLRYPAHLSVVGHMHRAAGKWHTNYGIAEF